MWNERSCTAAWTFFGIALLWDWNENWPFPVPWPLLSFPNLSEYWVSQDGWVERCALIFCENTKIATSCWTTINRRMLDPTKKDTPRPRAKEKPQQDDRRGEGHNHFKIKPHTCQRCLKCRNKTLCTQRPKERSSDIYKRLSQTCLWVSPMQADSALTCFRDRRSGCNSPGRHSMLAWVFWGRSPLPYHSLTLGQATGREHSPTHQQKVWLKIYWTWPCPPEQDSVLPTASLSHQKASTNFLYSSIRGETEWKT